MVPDKDGACAAACGQKKLGDVIEVRVVSAAREDQSGWKSGVRICPSRAALARLVLPLTETANPDAAFPAGRVRTGTRAPSATRVSQLVLILGRCRGLCQTGSWPPPKVSGATRATLGEGWMGSEPLPLAPRSVCVAYGAQSMSAACCACGARHTRVAVHGFDPSRVRPVQGRIPSFPAERNYLVRLTTDAEPVLISPIKLD